MFIEFPRRIEKGFVEMRRLPRIPMRQSRQKCGYRVPPRIPSQLLENGLYRLLRTLLGGEAGPVVIAVFN